MYSYEKLLLSFDVILDTFPFGGFISAFDAISCNKCIVTLPGNKLYGRVTQGLYKHMNAGLEESLIAKDENNYVELALKIAKYPPFRRKLEKLIGENKYKLYENRESIEEWYNLIINS
jgi:predicted O-linked N-acetylglucosamine transferase (SPINDLY family)